MSFRLRVAGRVAPEYQASLEQRWPLDCVSYEGFIDAPSFLREINTLVFPSEWLEALGNGVFEAYSQGVPVIGADAGGIAESIEDGVTGHVFEAGNANQLAQLMADMATATDHRTRLARAALEKAREYEAPRRAAEYIDFLQALLDRMDRDAAA